MNFTSGAFGDPAQIQTQILFWRKMENLHYPDAGQTRIYLERQLQRQMAMQQQMMAQQQAMAQQAQAQARQDAARNAFQQRQANRAALDSIDRKARENAARDAMNQARQAMGRSTNAGTSGQ